MYRARRAFTALVRYIYVVIIIFILIGCGKDDTTTQDDLLELNTKLTDELKLDLAYEGKVYQTDRIGEVSLGSCTDGDTANFISDGKSIAVRFLNVDTPETNGKLDPWGKAAKDFTCDKLTNAKTIVLEGRTNMFDTYGRYLAYVWYDGRLLNLELVELAYSKADETSDERYGDLFEKAETKARKTKKRVHGEKDPNYDYGRKTVTLEELRTNIEQYLYKNIEFTGIVTRELGDDAFVEQDGYGVYIYTNRNKTTRLTTGNVVTIKGTVSEFHGAYQIIGVSRINIEVKEEGRTDLIVPRVVNISQLSKDIEGSLLRLNELEITSVSSSSGGKNIYVKDIYGGTALIRIDDSVLSEFNGINFVVGETIDVIAPLSEFEGELQLMLCSKDDVIFY